MNVDALRKLEADKEEYFLIDVRESDEVRENPMKGMPYHHFPMSTFTNYVEKIPHDVPVVVFCAMGGRSAKISAYLEEIGFDDVYNLTGGMMAWKEKV